MSRFAFIMWLVTVAWPLVGQTSEITWRKVQLDPVFRSEGVAVADVNNDGLKDVLVGEYWYQAPNWERHEMQVPGDYSELVKVHEGKHGYSKVFACWADDFNMDGFVDLLVVGFPGEAAYWLENPRGQGTQSNGRPTHWQKHIVWHSACNETPLYADLLGTGQRVLIMGYQPEGKPAAGNNGQMAYFSPRANNPSDRWVMSPISDPATGQAAPGTHRFSHGLGIGDVNGDGRADVIVTEGWWEQPEKTALGRPWRFHPAKIGTPAADMYVLDVDGDGVNDIISTSAHKFGIWWHKQRPAVSPTAHSTFQTYDMFPDLVSETHAVCFVDLDGDGLKDLVTGKRKYSHGRNEPGADMPAAIYWFKAARGTDGMMTFTPHLIDDDSGIGTQFQVTDVDGDGLLDVVTSNKSGVHVFYQQRKNDH